MQTMNLSPSQLCFGVERVGEEMLEGFHPSPSTFLNGLRDTYLQAFDLSLGGPPIEGVPFLGETDGCTILIGRPLLSRLQRSA